MKDNTKVKNSYIYRHTKIGTSEIFYIGIGTQKNKNEYFRAHTKQSRNKWWKAVVAKYEHEVEILSHNLSWDEACELEKILIAYYKRKDCCGGTLVNLTDGGEGGCGVIKTEENINNWRKSNIGKQDGDKNTMFGKTRGKHHLAKEVLNLETGIFYDCALDASDNLPIAYSTFKSKSNRKITNDTSYTYVIDYEKGLLPFVKENETIKKIINIKTLEIFNTIIKASKSVNINPQTLGYKLNNSNDTDFQYLDDYEKGIDLVKKKRGWMKYVIDLQTGIFYDSLKEASYSYNYTYNHLKQMLNNNCKLKNKTSLRYI